MKQEEKQRNYFYILNEDAKVLFLNNKIYQLNKIIYNFNNS